MSDIERPWNAERDAREAKSREEAEVKDRRGHKWCWWGLAAAVALSFLLVHIAVNHESDPCYKARTSYRAYEIWMKSGHFDEAAGYYSDYVSYTALCNQQR